MFFCVGGGGAWDRLKRSTSPPHKHTPLGKTQIDHSGGCVCGILGKVLGKRAMHLPPPPPEADDQSWKTFPSGELAGRPRRNQRPTLLRGSVTLKKWEPLLFVHPPYFTAKGIPFL